MPMVWILDDPRTLHTLRALMDKTAFNLNIDDPAFRLRSALRYLDNAQTRAGRIAARESIDYWSDRLAAQLGLPEVNQ